MRESESSDGHVFRGGLKWFHWLVMTLSLLLTISAWWFARAQTIEKNRVRFNRYAHQLVELVGERMHTYSDALDSGVAMIKTHGTPSRAVWRRYAEHLRIDTKYPGINGIGIIGQTSRADLPALVERLRQERSDFRVHPKIDGDYHLPILYVEPEEHNWKAIGLDIAHEANRHAAALAARDTGLTQMTGPIVLVQDARKTAGFLLFAPLYDDPPPVTRADRSARFTGMVYAPFIVSRLVAGTLARTRRQVDFSLRDGDEILYDEHTSDLDGVDPDPLHRLEVPLELFGRTWVFDVRSNLAFRKSSGRHQPYLILGAGLVIDVLLLFLFILLTRAEQRAHAIAMEATADLRRRTSALQDSNARLERFASIAAHDLQEPNRKVVSFLGLLERRLGDQLDSKSRLYIDHAVSGALRMRDHISGVLAISQVNQQETREAVDLGALVDRIAARLTEQHALSSTWMTRDELPTINASRFNVDVLFENLIGNALKYRDGEPRVHVKAERQPNGWQIRVTDNGIGIEPKHRAQVFEMFRRLHGRSTYAGSGIGLALCEMVVATLGGQIGIDDGLPNASGGLGTTIWFTLVDRALQSESPAGID